MKPTACYTLAFVLSVASLAPAQTPQPVIDRASALGETLGTFIATTRFDARNLIRFTR